MTKSKTEQIKEQLEAQYDKYAEKFREVYQNSKIKTSESMEKALDSAREQLTDAGEFSSEQGRAFKEFLRRDIEQTSIHIKQLGSDAKEYLNLSRLGVGALASLSLLLDKAEDAVSFLREKTDKVLIFKTGEITSAGSLTCMDCGKSMQLKKTGHIPPCPKCANTKFRKGY